MTATSIFLLGAGCIDLTPVEDGNVGVDPGAYPGLRLSGEPNDTFDLALDVVFDANGRAQLQGSISPRNDVDVYALGPMTAGDRIIVDVVAHQGRLDSAIALFDEAGRITFENDDRAFELGQYDPFLNEVIRRTSATYFLAISRAPLDDTGRTGSYDVVISIARGGQPPATVPQTVLLDFRGGSIDIPGDRVYLVPPFNTADIDVRYAGMTAQVRQRIKDVVAENYEGLGLIVLAAPGDPIPAGPFSTIFFGESNPNAYGISQAVDAYNVRNNDQAIVFTELFTPDRFRRVLSADELGLAIGNIASHEIGHLLGLNHVANVQDIMDATGGAATFLLDQEFLNSPLEPGIFPIGTQDSFLLLLETIGG